MVQLDLLPTSYFQVLFGNHSTSLNRSHDRDLTNASAHIVVSRMQQKYLLSRFEFMNNGSAIEIMLILWLLQMDILLHEVAHLSQMMSQFRDIYVCLECHQWYLPSSMPL